MRSVKDKRTGVITFEMTTEDLEKKRINDKLSELDKKIKAIEQKFLLLEGDVKNKWVVLI